MMISKIVIEVADLMKAERELHGLIQKLQQNELHVKTIIGGISDWKGQSADELRNRLVPFYQGIQKQIKQIELHQMDLVKYTYRMKQADRQ
ncbi:hypothetical protein [Paenibacillus glacialis]|nr:hypothetical protein [Paenibacillus glacialis]